MVLLANASLLPPDGISIGSDVFFRAHERDQQTDRHTDRPRYSVCSDRYHLAIAAILREEMVRLGVDKRGLSEVRWVRQEHFTTLDGHTIAYSSRPTHGMSRVAVSIHRKVAGAPVGYEPISDRLIVVRLNAKPRNITLIQDSNLGLKCTSMAAQVIRDQYR